MVALAGRMLRRKVLYKFLIFRKRVQRAVNELFCQALRWQLRKQVIQIKGAGIHSEMAISRAGPLWLWFVPVKFDPVLVQGPSNKGSR